MSEDMYISTLISTAREYCENVTRIAFASQTIEMYLDYFAPCYAIEIPRPPPLRSIVSVKYKDHNGTEVTMIENSDYIVDLDSPVGRIVLPYGKTWPAFTPYSVNPIKIRFVCGYDTNDKIPYPLKQAMLLLIGHWYENREATGEATGQIAFAVKALLSQYKMGWF